MQRKLRRTLLQARSSGKAESPIGVSHWSLVGDIPKNYPGDLDKLGWYIRQQKLYLVDSHVSRTTIPGLYYDGQIFDLIQFFIVMIMIGKKRMTTRSL